jgi:hypothetical protein
MSIGRSGGGLVALGLLIWLAYTGRPSHGRVEAIDAAIAGAALGGLPAADQQRFKEQVEWVARNAGISGSVRVNQPLQRGGLNVIVSRPEFDALTRCGYGNALYDAAIDTIFVDLSLVRPAELPSIGSQGAITMFTLEQFGFVRSVVSFILAHEMGHRQLRARAGAFFQLPSGRIGSRDTDRELAADRFAVRTLLRAHEADDMPAFLRQQNALGQAGLSKAAMDGGERAAADILGAMIGMSTAMQFASGPYDPLFRDSEHPSFLERAAEAIRQVSAPAGQHVLARAPVVAEQIRRMGLIGNWSHQVLRFSEPLARVEVRRGMTWIGTRERYTGDTTPPTEGLYRLVGDTIQRRSSLVRRGLSGGALPGTWLNALLETGDESIGLGPVVRPRIRTERLFETFKRWRPDGLRYIGTGWFWNSTEGEDGIAVRDVEQAARELLRVNTVRIGTPQWLGQHVLVPVAAVLADETIRIRVLQIGDGQVLLAPAPFSTDFTVRAWIDIEGMTRADDGWLVPGRTMAPDSPHWKLWRLGDGGSAHEVADGRLLASFAGPLRNSVLRASEPNDQTRAKIQPLGNGRALVWFDFDSVWLVGAGEAQIVFHPADKDLRVTLLDEETVLLWIENALKAYVISLKAAASISHDTHHVAAALQRR